VAFVQTNVEDTDEQISLDRAESLAADLCRHLPATAVVVTLGRYGALARTATGTYRATVPQVPIRHTHGAGAAFSAGLAHAHLAGASIADALHAGCAAGTHHCAATPPVLRPRTPAVLVKESQP
jgi:fructose-1-phosphate kinase PfkB-like protein